MGFQFDLEAVLIYEYSIMKIETCETLQNSLIPR